MFIYLVTKLCNANNSSILYEIIFYSPLYYSSYYDNVQTNPLHFAIENSSIDSENLAEDDEPIKEDLGDVFEKDED